VGDGEGSNWAGDLAAEGGNVEGRRVGCGGEEEEDDSGVQKWRETHRGIN